MQPQDTNNQNADFESVIRRPASRMRVGYFQEGVSADIIAALREGHFADCLHVIEGESGDVTIAQKPWGPATAKKRK